MDSPILITNRRISSFLNNKKHNVPKNLDSHFKVILNLVLAVFHMGAIFCRFCVRENLTHLGISLPLKTLFLSVLVNYFHSISIWPLQLWNLMRLIWNLKIILLMLINECSALIFAVITVSTS